jgi:hypothetical protein
MITNNGKEIIGKFLLGQAPEFATYIAAGCGPAPLFPNQDLTEGAIESFKTKRNLDFEVFRVPVSAKGFIKEDGVEKIVLKAEMPTDQRFLISEVGFYPAANNTLAGAYDSKTLATFSPSENWIVNTESSSQDIPTITDESQIVNTNGDLIIAETAYFLNSDAEFFNDPSRKNRQEPPRFYNRALAVSGSSSLIDENFVIAEEFARSSIENTSLAFNFSQNLPTDEIKLAFSVVSNTKSNSNDPFGLRIILDFVNDLPSLELLSPRARLEIELDPSDFTLQDTGQIPDPKNRYFVVTKKLSDFILDDTFSWANINLIRIYSSVLQAAYLSNPNYTIIFDGLRLENVSSQNPLYDLVGYNVIKSDSAYPVLKSENTNNFIEYRFGIGVDG